MKLGDAVRVKSTKRIGFIAAIQRYMAKSEQVGPSRYGVDHRALDDNYPGFFGRAKYTEEELEKV